MTPRNISSLLFGGLALAGIPTIANAQIGKEVAIPTHLSDGQEFLIRTGVLIDHGKHLFSANWTGQEGGGRPMTKGTGNPLADPSDKLIFPKNFNRISAPDANSCAGCHNAPFGIAGGGGDIVGNVFVLGQRFDFATFNHAGSTMPTKNAFDEAGNPVILQSIANSRATLGMFGSGYIEMLAREITAELQMERNTLPPTGGTIALMSKGISYGTLKRNGDGTWDVSGVTGLVAPSLSTSGQTGPNLIIRPFHQASNVVSIRQFSNNAFNHHHGIQTEERFGIGADPDGDGYVNEMTIADVTAVSVFQATMAVPGRRIPTDPTLKTAIALGEQRFQSINCVRCHIPTLPLSPGGNLYTEPNPYNPNSPPNLQVGNYPTLTVDLNSMAISLPLPRLSADGMGITNVPAFTDLKVHDITSGAGDPNREALDMNQPAGSGGFFAGNPRFITRKLWGAANEPPYFHHGQYATLRQAVEAHAGEAAVERAAYGALPMAEQDAVIEFLKSLQVAPPTVTSLVFDEFNNPTTWPAFPATYP
ncbi:MAG: thiol oxidoreductase [Planctomycetes bacterium]|nr:thiol oxidoreductase [Planctomycetota bacterium]